MARSGRQEFRNDLEVAEIATMCVCANLEFEETHVAAALQPVARAAWELVDGSGEVGLLRREVRKAESRLRLACFAQGERRFLKHVRRYLDGRDA